MSKRNASAVDEVIEAERRWVQAHRELDLVSIESMLSEDYVQIRADGSVIGKLEAIESYRSGKRRWDHVDSDQYRVSVHGDVAILVGRWIGRGEDKGARFDYTARFMAVYAKRDGIWQLVADQSTPLNE